MALFGKIASLFGNKPDEPSPNPQALIVEVQIDQSSDEPAADFFEFEERLIQHVENGGYGEYDGNEVAMDGSHARIYMYAPNADDMLQRVAPQFLDGGVVADASFLLRYGEAGDPSAREVTLSLEQVRKMFS